MFKCFFISKHLDLDQIAHSIISDLYRTKMYPNKGDCVCLDLETNVVRLSLNFICNAPCYTGMQYFLYNKAWIGLLKNICEPFVHLNSTTMIEELQKIL